MCQVGSTWLEAVHPLSKLLKVVRCPFTTEAINSASSSCFFPSAAEVPATCFGVALTPMVQALSCLSCILKRSEADESSRQMSNALIVAYPHKLNPTIALQRPASTLLIAGPPVLPANRGRLMNENA